MQRGGTPTAFDRVLSTKYGTAAMRFALEGKFGNLVVIKNGKMVDGEIGAISYDSLVSMLKEHGFGK